MPPPTPLNASERKLGWFMLAAIPLAVVVMEEPYGIDGAEMLFRLITKWVGEQWDRLSRGSWPDISVWDTLYLFMVGLPVGTAVLMPWHFWHLLRRRSRTWPEALWVWSGLYGLMSAGVGVTYLILVIRAEPIWWKAPADDFILILGELTIGLAISVLGFRTWRRRRREDRMPIAANANPDPARPD